MIESVLLNYLSETLSCPVRMEHEPGLKGKYVIIEKTGGSASNHIRNSVIAIQSYAERMAEAAKLNEEVIAAMDEAAALPEISSARLNSNYNFTDTTTKEYRYQAVFDIVYYTQEV